MAPALLLESRNLVLLFTEEDINCLLIALSPLPFRHLLILCPLTSTPWHIIHEVQSANILLPKHNSMVDGPSTEADQQ